MLDFLKELNSTTLMILVFAAILVIFLLILIIVTVNVLKGSGSDDDEEYEEDIPKKRSSKKAPEIKTYNSRKEADSEDDEASDDDSDDEASGEDEDEDDEDDNADYHGTLLDEFDPDELEDDDEEDDSDVDSDDEEDDDSYDDEAEEDEAYQDITDELKSDSADVAEDEDDDEGESDEDYDPDEHPENTNKLDISRIRAALKGTEVRESSEKAAAAVEKEDYNASLDSAFAEDTVTTATEIFTLSDEAIEAATETSMDAHEKIVAEKEEKLADTASEEAPATVITEPVPDPIASVSDILAAHDEKITVNPVNAVNINTVNSVDKIDTKNADAGINGMEDMENFLTENPVPKKKKKKVKKKDQKFEEKFDSDGDEIATGDYFWYNSQDIDGLKKKEDMYFYCHYFNKPKLAVVPLVTEMYDCAFVRTEEIQRIAYGISFKSMKMKDILSAKENVSFDRSKATKEPSDRDKEEIYEKWCGYVDNFLGIIVINAPDEVKDYLKNKLYEYGHSDIDTLLFSPE